MAALDFGMALARGMLPSSEAAQKDLINLAGGRNIFKSEDWWNKQVDTQISSGYRTVKEQGREYLMPSGEYQLGRREVNTSYRPPAPSGPFGGGSSYSSSPFSTGPVYPGSPIAALMGGWTASQTISYEAPKGALVASYNKDKVPQYTSRVVDVYGNRKDYTAGELSDIEAGAKAGAARAKKQTEQAKASQKRLRRGTGGLAAKAILPGDKPATGLPALGETGLGLGTATLGKGLML